MSGYVYDPYPSPGKRTSPRPEDGTTAGVNRLYVESIRRSIRGLIPHLLGSDPLVLRADGRTDYLVVLRDETIGSRVVLQAFPIGRPKR